jgi:hypothetical protein
VLRKDPMQTFLDALLLARGKSVQVAAANQPAARVTINGQPSPSIRSNKSFYKSWPPHDGSAQALSGTLDSALP